MKRTRFSTRYESLEKREMFAGLADVLSVDDMFDAVEQGDPAADINEDQQVDADDVRFLVEEVLGTRMADSNLDGAVNFTDFLHLSANFGNTDAIFSDGDANGDGQVQFADFLELTSTFGFEAEHRVVSIHDGAPLLPNRSVFEMLAHTENVPGAIGIREVKFIVDVAANEVYFSNQNTHRFHYFFAATALGFEGTNSEYTRQTYFTDNRTFVAGSILAHDNHGESDESIYTLEFWPADPVKANHVNQTMQLVSTAMPFAEGRLFYHPAGETQRELFVSESEIYAAANTPTISTEALYGNQSYTALNPGVAYGRLRVVDSSNSGTLSIQDLVIFETIPNDLTHVAGVITVEPQTPLSHVNLRAKQNDTPNAYIRDALQDQEIQELIGKTVRFEATSTGYTIREATAAEVEEHFASIRPSEAQFAARDLTRTEIVPLNSLRLADQVAYGAKAANLGELTTILPSQQVRDGVAIPFAMYDEFMTFNGFYDEAVAMMNDPTFQTDSRVRDRMLDDFRDRIQDGDIPPQMSSKLEAAYTDLKQQFGVTASFRSRSSTNNEDLVGFTGAGLYRSYTHRPHEGKLENTIRQVWSSLWTFRAFEEREFWRIDHLTAAMGVAVHPNFDLEQVNGVAVTKNIYDPNWLGFYVNAQVGEDLVTNPEGGAIPEEFLISRIGANQSWEVQYIRQSNLTEDGANVLSNSHIEELRTAMWSIQNHFRRVYEKQTDRSFAMDIEFKVDAEGQLVIKQARPWVD